MFQSKRQAFTMLELTFVITIIGILAAIAVPKFAATRDQAMFTKSATTLAAVRNSISTERQKRTLQGLFDPITDLDAEAVDDGRMFSVFNDTTVPGRNIVEAQRRVLEYPVNQGNGDGQWQKNGMTYTAFFKSGRGCIFTLGGNRLTLTGGAGGMTLARCQEIFEN